MCHVQAATLCMLVDEMIGGVEVPRLRAGEASDMHMAAKGLALVGCL